MLKKLFAISTLLLVLVIGALFVYNFLFKKTSPQTAEKAPASEEGKKNLPTSQKSGQDSDSAVFAVSDQSIYGATLAGDQKFIYFFLASSGQINQVDFAGKLEKVISTESFSGIKKIVWNKPRNGAIVKTESEPGKMRFFYFNVAGGKVTPLKENIDSVTWSNLGDKLIYKYFDPATKKRTVSVSDPDGKNWRDLTEFDYREVEISAIQGSGDLSFWPSPNAFTSTSLVKIGFNGENKKEILKDKYGADFLWSPDGSRLIASCSDQKGGHKTELFQMNKDGGQLQSLLFPSFASKCTWAKDSKTLFCALPGNIAEAAVLPNDWQKGSIASADTFWKIDTSNGKKERVIDPEKIEGAFDAISLFLSPDEKTLFFVNKSDGKLYKLNL